MSYVAVLPSVYPPYTETSAESCKMQPLLIVDNTEVNIGSTGAWNRGIDYVEEHGLDWLVVFSAALVFGPPGGLDFISVMESSVNCRILEADGVFGWHLMAFNWTVFKDVGRFDENFWPYGEDDIDYSLRYQRTYDPDWPASPRPDGRFWFKTPVDVEDRGMGHSFKLGPVRPDGNSRDYYEKKWGGPKQQECFDRPFNDPTKSLRYWPTPDRAGAGSCGE